MKGFCFLVSCWIITSIKFLAIISIMDIHLSIHPLSGKNVYFADSIYPCHHKNCLICSRMVLVMKLGVAGKFYVEIRKILRFKEEGKNILVIKQFNC